MKHPFEQVVREHSVTVLRVCRAVLGPQDADDAWSDTFLAAFTAYPQLEEDANVKAWLVTIAHRKALDSIRARSRRAVTVDALPEQVSSIGIPGARDRDLYAALAGLSGRARQALAYHYLGGLAYKDVAALIGGSTDAARRAASDGLAKLRGRYSSMDDAEGEQ